MPGRFRWVVVLLLFAVTIINYIDRSAIAFAANEIQAAFGINATQLGFILGAFGIGYIVSTLFGGMAVDRFGSKIALAACLFIWSLAIGWTGAASGFVMLYAARTVLGLAEGPSFPTMTSAVTKWLPPEERATALGGALVAVPVALAIGSPLVSFLIETYGWRPMFYTLCFFGLLWLPCWIYFFADEPSESTLISNQERLYIEAQQRKSRPVLERHTPTKEEWRILLHNPTLRANYWPISYSAIFSFSS